MEFPTLDHAQLITRGRFKVDLKTDTRMQQLHLKLQLSLSTLSEAAFMSIHLPELSGGSQGQSNQSVDTPSDTMNALKYLSLVGKIAGFVSALNVIPFVDQSIGVFIFAAASILKDTVNRIGDVMGDGKQNASFQG
jgi:hypothetical protein